MTPSAPVTIRDIAREVGCSTATVSNVLNGCGRIGKATAKRVQATCQRLGYAPNSAGRSLRNRKTENIGLLFYPSCAKIFRNIFYSEVLAGLEERLAAAGYNLLLASYNIATQHNEIPKFIREGNVDGVILLGGCPDNFKSSLARSPKPVLLLDTDSINDSVDSVTTDGFRAEMDAVSYLVKNGHRRIAMLCHTFDNYNESMRMEGFLSAARRFGIETTCSVIRVETNDEAAQSILKQFKTKEPYTAACFVNDDMAVHVMLQLQSKGLSVPKDLSVIGFDNTTFSQTITPKLTTIAIDREQLGTEGAELLLYRLNNPDLPVKKVTIPTQLIERESVKSV